MNLSELTKDENLKQDGWSTLNLKFGSDGQLEVIGWCGRNRTTKYYILKCHQCSKDPELFGDGYFKSIKGDLIRGIIPCGCGRSARYSEEQMEIICKRKACALGYSFVAFYETFRGRLTKISLSCDKHGEWNTTTVSNLIHRNSKCPRCKIDMLADLSRKSDNVMIESFLESGGYDNETKFWRSDRVTKFGAAVYWHVYCPDCETEGEALAGDLQQGKRPCLCSPSRQRECYINLLYDGDFVVAVKFGIANNSASRLKKQSYKCIYDIQQHSVWSFPDKISCLKAERDCLKELICGIIPKAEMSDGWTETTFIENIVLIENIYTRNGGVRL